MGAKLTGKRGRRQARRALDGERASGHESVQSLGRDIRSVRPCDRPAAVDKDLTEARAIPERLEHAVERREQGLEVQLTLNAIVELQEHAISIQQPDLDHVAQHAHHSRGGIGPLVIREGPRAGNAYAACRRFARLSCALRLPPFGGPPRRSPPPFGGPPASFTTIGRLRIWTLRIRSITRSTYSEGISTNVNFEWTSMAPMTWPGISASPAMAPTMSPGRTPASRPASTKSRTIGPSTLGAAGVSGMASTVIGLPPDARRAAAAAISAMSTPASSASSSTSASYGSSPSSADASSRRFLNACARRVATSAADGMRIGVMRWPV